MTGLTRRCWPRNCPRPFKVAHDRLRPARLGAGAARAEGISYNRRLIRHDGKVEMSLTLPPPYEGLKFGPVDPEAGLLRN